MAPDRGAGMSPDPSTSESGARLDGTEEVDLATSRSIANEPIGQEPDRAFLARRSEQPQFTLRALICGLFIGVLIAFSNTYFGLQTGWISGMAMPSALIAFAYFKGLRTLTAKMGSVFKRLGLGEGFSEVENVLVQTVAGSVGTMPLGCGFVGVLPALEYLLKPEETPESSSLDPSIVSALAEGKETGGLRLPLEKLILWALGLCFFGVFFAVPLRKEVIVREKLRFPSGTATALMIGVLHGGEKQGGGSKGAHDGMRRRHEVGAGNDDEESRRLMGDVNSAADESATEENEEGEPHVEHQKGHQDWIKQIRLLTNSFMVSGIYTITSYFIPQIHNIPFLGPKLGYTWLWTLNPSPAYFGQGIIMGPTTTIHMFLGAVIGWAVLSPIAKFQGWAPGDVDDWSTGSKGWIVWVSLAIMLADAIVSLGWLVLRPTLWYIQNYGPTLASSIREKNFRKRIHDLLHPSTRGYSPISLSNSNNNDLSKPNSHSSTFNDDEPEYDAPPAHLISLRITLVGLILSLAFCLFAVQFSFKGIISLPLTILAIVFALVLSIMGVRALGETDINPVSGISKLTQLLFTLVVPSNSRNAVTINLLAGAISESGALQAGDLLQDLKTGHLLGASPKAQFYGQLIGSGIGAIVSACVYRLYTHVYRIPGGLFQVPTGYVWIFTARLVTGQGLPPKTTQFAAAAAVVWAVLTALRIYGGSVRNADGSKGARWTAFIPGGIAVAVGMYNTPSFTLTRTAGGLVVWWWKSRRKREETPMVVLASGLILGEGLLSIVNLVLAGLSVPHL